MTWPTRIYFHTQPYNYLPHSKTKAILLSPPRGNKNMPLFVPPFHSYSLVDQLEGPQNALHRSSKQPPIPVKFSRSPQEYYMYIKIIFLETYLYEHIRKTRSANLNIYKVVTSASLSTMTSLTTEKIINNNTTHVSNLRLNLDELVSP